MSRIAVLNPLFPPATLGGGPIRTAEALARALEAEGFQLAILTSDRDLGCATPLKVPANEWIPWSSSQVNYVSMNSVQKMLRALRALRNGQPDFVYVNSFFDPHFSILPLLLTKVGFWGNSRIVIAPRGEFGSGALSLKSQKKQRYIQATQRLRLLDQVVWHASSADEARDIKSVIGGDPEIFIAEDEVLLPETPLAPHESSRPGEPLKLMFLGRINRMKGLHILMAALVGASFPVTVDVYGNPEDASYLAECEEIIGSLPPHVEVRLRGAADHAQVRELLNRHDALALPTLGENFGHVVPEALSASCPVLLSDNTIWSSLVRTSGLVVVPNEPEAWTAALEQLHAMRQEGRLPDLKRRAGSNYLTWFRNRNKRSVFKKILDSRH